MGRWITKYGRKIYIKEESEKGMVIVPPYVYRFICSEVLSGNKIQHGENIIKVDNEYFRVVVKDKDSLDFSIKKCAYYQDEEIQDWMEKEYEQTSDSNREKTNSRTKVKRFKF